MPFCITRGFDAIILDVGHGLKLGQGQLLSPRCLAVFICSIKANLLMVSKVKRDIKHIQINRNIMSSMNWAMYYTN